MEIACVPILHIYVMFSWCKLNPSLCDFIMKEHIIPYCLLQMLSEYMRYDVTKFSPKNNMET